jgi:hypothetical protein
VLEESRRSSTSPSSSVTRISRSSLIRPPYRRNGVDAVVSYVAP